MSGATDSQEIATGWTWAGISHKKVEIFVERFKFVGEPDSDQRQKPFQWNPIRTASNDHPYS